MPRLCQMRRADSHSALIDAGGHTADISIEMSRWPFMLSALLVGALAASTFAQDLPTVAAFYRPVKLFDFDERRRGNFDETPAGWKQLAGPGLPAYSRGVLDDQVGCDAPSFRLDLRGGNIAYEYDGPELTLSPNSDHVVVGYIRTSGLRDSAAFITALQVDPFGVVVPGGVAISELMRPAPLSLAPSGSAGDAIDPPVEPSDAAAAATPGLQPAPTTVDAATWQRVEIPIHAAAGAVRVRLQLWLLQDYVWQAPAAVPLDPILRHDISGQVWFDNIGLHRLPRLRVRFSEAAGVLTVGDGCHVTIELLAERGEPWAALVELQNDADGEVSWRHTVDFQRDEAATSAAFHTSGGTSTAGPLLAAARGTTVANAHGAAPVADALAQRRIVPIPTPPPGRYRVRVALRQGEQVAMRRAVSFTILPELVETARSLDEELGIDLGLWPIGAPPGAERWLGVLGVGAVKIGLPLGADPYQPGQRSYFESAQQLARTLATDGLAVTAVLRGADDQPIAPRLQRSVIDRSGLNELLAYLGATINSWQFGDEVIEARNATPWPPSAQADVRERLTRFLARPELIFPQPWWSAPSAELLLNQESATGKPRPAAPPADFGESVESYGVPLDTGPRVLPWALAFLHNAQRPRTWLTLEVGEAAESEGAEDHVAHWAQRFVLTRALAPTRCYLPAPMRISRAGGEAAWEPTPLFTPLRTLIHALRGLRIHSVVPLGAAGRLFEFRGGGQVCHVAWTRTVGGEEVALPAATNLHAIDLWGREVPTRTDGARLMVTLRDQPILFTEFNAASLLISYSISVEPTELELGGPFAMTELRLNNPLEREFRGRIELSIAPPWTLTPTSLDFDLPVGGKQTWPLRIEFPERPIAMQQPLRVRVIPTPGEAPQTFHVPLAAGLNGLSCEATVQRDGDRLTIEQTLRNDSRETVSFTAFCEAPKRARLEGQFIRIAPGESRAQVYQYDRPEELEGAIIELGLIEISGERRLYQVVVAAPTVDQEASALEETPHP